MTDWYQHVPGETLPDGSTYYYAPTAADDDEDDAEYVANCPACGSPIDYCQGHGEIGDPAGHAILAAHDAGDHVDCHPDGCDDAPTDTEWLKSMVKRHGHGGV